MSVSDHLLITAASIPLSVIAIYYYFDLCRFHFLRACNRRHFKRTSPPKSERGLIYPPASVLHFRAAIHRQSALSFFMTSIYVTSKAHLPPNSEDCLKIRPKAVNISLADHSTSTYTSSSSTFRLHLNAVNLPLDSKRR